MLRITSKINLEDFAQTRKLRKDNNAELNSLAEKAQEGDIDAQELLLARVDKLIIKYVRKYVRNSDMIEDCLQQCRFHLLKMLYHFDCSKPFIPWLTTVVRNCTLNYLRTQKKWRFYSISNAEEDGVEIQPECDLECVSEAIYREEISGFLHDALNTLKDEFKRVIMYHYFENMSCKDISRIEKAPIGTIKNRLFKARQALKGQLAHIVS
ncbi:MAG: sigma-70 family RNA polymerase sigma factor [Planctomycetes bacterium]|nr:sigma-70 family RNA polymerase sigma factor [Planctomycetota bacterium]